MTLPETRSGNGRPYRIWTVGHLPLEQLPRFEPGPTAPAFVTTTDWTVIAADHTLYVHRAGIQHELHNTTWGGDDDARRAAYGAGLLGVMVYDDEATLNGFPSAS